MDRDAVLLVQLLAFAVLGNSLLTPGLAAKDLANMHNQLQSNQSDEKIVRICNATAMLEKVYWCGYLFENQLNEMNSSDWCNFTLIAGYYSTFSFCTEFSTESVYCYWPNPQVEKYVINIHKLFFSNCTSEIIIFQDPPDDILFILITVPICLTIVMIAVVVWCSKRSDILV
ncbi:receptor activity-modifying protein 3-like [Pristis pectinata]|uniref:receptor activity-modifying protein 3-like n=1 Tax=Pristis pectinata TaxID=685728 RepID=UPI00223E7994|nr:receptor activity-modifying protein 3-like [Pristis pectinata]